MLLYQPGIKCAGKEGGYMLKTRKIIFFISLVLITTYLVAQEEAHEVRVVNIEVPVRVFKGHTFVDNLTLDDFEVFEDGEPQKVVAVYLIKKASVERKQEKKKFTPKTERNFYLVFEISDYTPRIEEALRFFFENVLIPDDNLSVITPLKTYKMKNEALKTLPPEKIVHQLKEILREDALKANTGYRSALKELAGLAKALTGGMGETGEVGAISGISGAEFEGLGLDELLNLYLVTLEKLENLRKIDEQELLNFSNYLKGLKGQKYVFLFYQREFIPQIERRIIDQKLEMYQDRFDIILKVNEIFKYSKREISFNVERVKQAYADSSISIHFLFFTKPAEYIRGVQMEERSEDIFSAFRELAISTGGSVESSANPEFLFQKASHASENYYLLYYSPSNYRPDGRFRKIEVKIKGKKYRIFHRAGYFAN